MSSPDPDPDATYRDFKDAVNMTASELDRWLDTDESKEVGQKDGGESTGHASGRRIVRILGKKKDDLTDADYDHMRKVVGYVHRHCAQGGPAEDAAHSRWAYSLKNWGHDPGKS